MAARSREPSVRLAWFGVVLAAQLVAPLASAQLSTKPGAIVSKVSGKCLSVKAASVADATPAVQYVCDSRASSAFTLEPFAEGFRIIAAHSGSCLSVKAASTARSAKVVQSTCLGTSNEVWLLESYNGFYRLKAKHSAQCLNVPNSSTANNTELVQYDCQGKDNELWSFADAFIASTEPARLVSNSGQCASVDAASNGLQLPCKAAASADDQSFTLERAGDAYRLVAQHSGQCLTVSAASLTDGASVIQAPCQDAAQQLWTTARHANGFAFANKNSGRCLDTAGGSTAAGARLVQATCAGVSSQDFRVSAQASLGEWSSVSGLPIVPVAAAALANGKVMLWSAYDAYTFGGDRGKTDTALYDPATNGAIRSMVVNTAHDMFCPGTSMLSDGRLLVSGGSSAQKTSIYDSVTQTWSKAALMKIARGYQGNTVLDTGDVFTIGGSWSGGQGNKTGEVWSPVNGWTLRPGAPVAPILGTDPQGVYRSDNHAWLFGVAGGAVFHAGPSAQMNWFGTSGTGSTSSAGKRADDAYSINGNAVMYDVGRILKVGGAPAYQKANASKGAYVIDINSGVVVTKTAPLAYARSFQNSVVLPDGRVVVIGGQAYAVPFTDATAALPAEIWDPATSAFTTVATMGVPRTYHSIALLLPDARVLVGGGGLCGATCNNNHPNVQTYSPDYLFAPNGSAAVRPVITAAPATASFGQQISVSTDRAVASFALVRMSSVTHSTNNDQRRIPLSVNGHTGTTYTLTTPANAGIATPGYYMLFALDAASVPSVAAIVQVR